jgi:hypothetical protein
MPNDRQLAVLIWLGVAAVLMLLNHDLRRSLHSVIRSLLAGKVTIVFVMMTLWVAGELLLARRLSWWDTGMTTSTAFWFVGSGFVLFINTPKAAEEEHFFRRSFLTAIKLSVFLGVFMNLFVLNLPAELVLQLVLFFLFAMSAVASHKDEFKQVKTLVDALIGIALAGLVIYEVATVASDWSTISHSGLVWQFFLPVWLTLGLLPFIFLAGVYSEYELAFLRTEWTTGRRWGRRLALVTSFGLQSHRLHSFIGTSAHQLSDASSFADARRAIRDSRDREATDEDVEESSSV